MSGGFYGRYTPPVLAQIGPCSPHNSTKAVSFGGPIPGSTLGQSLLTAVICELGVKGTTEPTGGTQKRKCWGGPTNGRAAACRRLAAAPMDGSK